MYAEFRYQDGAYAGETRIIRKDFATVGRHPSADLPFDAKKELEVSGRHAAVFRHLGVWVVRDLGSTNGTFLNGNRIKGDQPLKDGDVLRFGARGPQLEFHEREGDPPTVPLTRRESAPAREPGTGTRIRAEVQRQTTGWRRLTIALGVVTVLLAAGGGYLFVKTSRAAAAERARLVARADTLISRMQAHASVDSGLAGALAQAREETERLRSELTGRNRSSRAGDSIAMALARSLESHDAVVRAAELDVEGIARSQGDAVALVVSELPDGRRIAGSGFAIRARGDTGWVVTNRHLTRDSAGRAAVRLGVIFNGSSQNFRAELLATSDSADLAVLRVRVRGGVPAVRGLGSPPHRDDPAAILGFPFGLDFPGGGDWRTVGVHIRRFGGTIHGVSRDRLDVDSYGAGGSSGSPVFNASGEVIGVVFGGDPASAGRIVYAVPVEELREWLAIVLGR